MKARVASYSSKFVSLTLPVAWYFTNSKIRFTPNLSIFHGTWKKKKNVEMTWKKHPYFMGVRQGNQI